MTVPCNSVQQKTASVSAVNFQILLYKLAGDTSEMVKEIELLDRKVVKADRNLQLRELLERQDRLLVKSWALSSNAENLLKDFEKKHLEDLTAMKMYREGLKEIDDMKIKCIAWEKVLEKRTLEIIEREKERAKSLKELKEAQKQAENNLRAVEMGKQNTAQKKQFFQKYLMLQETVKKTQAEIYEVKQLSVDLNKDKILHARKTSLRNFTTFKALPSNLTRKDFIKKI